MEEYDSGVYEVVPGMDDEPFSSAPLPPPPPPGSRRPNASTPAPSAIKTFASRKPSSLENYDDNDYPAINNNVSQVRRKSDGLPVNVRHQISNGDDDDVLNTLKISNVKSKLKPVATKIFDSPNNSKDVEDRVVSPSWAPNLKPVKIGVGGFGSPKGPAVAEKRPVVEMNSPPPVINDYKAKTTVAPTLSEVGNGANSLRIKGQLAGLRPVKTSNDFVNSYMYSNATEFTSDQSGSPAWSRDVMTAPAPSGKKIPPAGPPSPKKSPAASAPHLSQPRNRSPSPPPFPSPPPSPPPLRDFPFPPPPDPKKTPPFGPTATKFSSSDGAQRSRPLQPTKGTPLPLAPSPTVTKILTSDSPQRPRPLQPTKDPPAPSRPLVPLPSPSECTCHLPPSHNPTKPSHCQSQNGLEKQKHREEVSRTPGPADRSVVQISTQPPSEKTRHAPVPKPPLERSQSESKSTGYDNNDEHGQRSHRIDEGTQDRNSSLDRQSWFFGDLDREESETMLNRLSKEDGSYLVRNSQRGGPDMPYSLSIVFKRHIYHLNIRIRPDGKFSIGKAKSDEKVFNGVVELIAFHRNNPIELIGDNHKKTTSGKVTLNKHPTR